jgi:tRNA pseudouridine32 synthase / 23S rRNA pseudouridine746 synthase
MEILSKKHKAPGVDGSPMDKFEFHKIHAPDDPKTICDFLALHTGLSRQALKLAMQKGAVWLKPVRGGQRRIRKAKFEIHSGDRISLFHDPKILTFMPPSPRCLSDFNHYSLWFKPVGLLSQGSLWGDHASLLRQVAVFFKPRRPAFLVHRLDREASGVMIVAHTAEAAARISSLFQRREVAKHYLVEVKGSPGGTEGSETICSDLDGRPASTSFVVKTFNPERRTSIVEVRIETGRKHQIRRHFEGIGCPVMGDPLYGSGNKDPGGLRLCADAITFTCPFTGRPVSARLEISDIPWIAPAAE